MTRDWFFSRNCALLSIGSAMAIARQFNLNPLVVRDRALTWSRAMLHALRQAPMAVESVRGNVQGGNGHEMAAARPRMRRRRDGNCCLPEPEPGNRQLPKGNPKTRSLLRVDSPGVKRAPPALPALSNVPLAAVSSVRMLLVRQSASEESV